MQSDRVQHADRGAVQAVDREGRRHRAVAAAHPLLPQVCPATLTLPLVFDLIIGGAHYVLAQAVHARRGAGGGDVQHQDRGGHDRVPQSPQRRCA